MKIYQTDCLKDGPAVSCNNNYEYFDALESDEKNKKFEKKHEEFLEKLKNMPKGEGTKEARKAQKEARVEYLKKFSKEQKEEYDEFILDLMDLYKPGSLKQLKKRLVSVPTVDARKYKNQMKNLEPDIVPGKKERELDYCIFLDAIEKAVQDYTGINSKGEKYSFIQCVVNKYKQSAQEEYGKRTIKKGGIFLNTPEKNQHYILTLSKKAKKLKEQEGKNASDAIDAVLQEITGHKFTKLEKQWALDLVNGLDMTLLSDSLTSDDDSEAALLGGNSDAKNDYERMEKNLLANSFLKKMVAHFERKWQNIKDATDKQSREWIKIFLSKDFLILLKLYALSDIEERKTYKEFIEPNCKQWCHRREHCKDEAQNAGKDKERIGCYIRYGQIIKEKEAGDEEIYNILKEQEDFLYDCILKNDYIDFAYQDEISSLYDIYSKQLKGFNGTEPENRFRFTDAVIAYALGEDKTKVSKRRKKYETQTREELYKLFSDSFSY